MRTTVDFALLFRSSIGFDQMLNTIETASRGAVDNWPPYDIVKTGDDDYRITLAVAGFGLDDLIVTQEQNTLIVAGQKSGEGSGRYLYQGIAGRSFQRRFLLAAHVKVVGSSLVNGLLTVDLKRELPEEMKLRRIAITTSEVRPKFQTQQMQPEKQAA